MPCEDGRVVRRLIAPPTLPRIVRPRTSDGTEHISTQDPGTDPSDALLRDTIVHSRFATLLLVHSLPDARAEEPFHQLGAPNPKRTLKILVRPGTEAVDGNREAFDDESGHDGCSLMGR
jgi:hypothetical protein